jgi:hypothetical protein
MFEGLNKTLVKTPQELIEGLDDKEKYPLTLKRDKNGTTYVREIIMAYDSETAQDNVIEFDEKNRPFENHYACQISHQLCIEDKGIIVRTVDEFIDLLEFLRENLCRYVEWTDEEGNRKYQKEQIIIYVHNLDYDLTFLLWRMMEHKTDDFVIKSSYSMFEYKNCIVFKDSKNLLGHGLAVSIEEYLGKDSLFTKRYGMWDYDILRSPLYELSDAEIEYAMVDVFALIEILRVIIKNNGIKYSQLPVTKSTFVGRRMYKDLLGGKKVQNVENLDRDYKRYYDAIHEKNLTYDMLMQAKEAYYGGVSFTHPLFADKYISNPGDYDLSSEYPRALVAQLFPSSAPIYNPNIKSIADIEKWHEYRPGHEGRKDARGGFIAKFTFHNYVTRNDYPIPFLFSYEQIERGEIEAKRYILTGNRLYKAKTLTVYLCDVDYDIVKKTATWDSCDVDKVISYELGPLPQSLVRLILQCYSDKTTLKGVLGEEVKYTDAKIFVNTIYGKQGQFPVNDKYVPDELGHPVKIITTREEKEKQLEESNNKFSRTTYYLWGVYTASYGHKFLYNGMKIVKEDIRFCDTDSVKYANRDKYEPAFQDYNEQNEAWLRFTGKYWYEFTDEEIENLYFPKTKDGEVKPIGNWDSEVYDSKMGTMIGAISKRSKCYVMFFDKEGVIDMKFTCAGIAKSAIKGYCLVTICKDENEVYERKVFDKNKINQEKQEAIRREVGKFRVEDKNGNLDYIKSVVKFFQASPAIPPEFTNKMTKLVNYNQKPHSYTDAQGNQYTMTNTTAVYLIPCGFKLNSMDISDALEEFLTGDFIIDEEETDGTYFE